MVGEHLMFFQNNTRSNQFNQPKIQWHSGNIGYSSVQVLHPMQDLPVVTARKARVLDFSVTYHSAISEFFFSKNTFSVQ